MSVAETRRLTTERYPKPPDAVSGPHANGYLVYTGLSVAGNNGLYIHEADQCTNKHSCWIYEYNAVMLTVLGRGGPSAEMTIEEHGWFRDRNLFQVIANARVIPAGPGDQFIKWRDSLLAILNAVHGGVGGPWTRIN
ncbi:hypothetical protein BDU57DRAFT_579745 [Ampelomyces quisqualis]|uniref:Uncharacterized protein n=1 Tax=Ampelomyces quisqualis TaxID=50730 RepID=A0A6A5QF41_AMPQU|nr:hypothetical protein BDU57DRAFT_579745 [Ampelomyces quisqualis]